MKRIMQDAPQGVPGSLEKIPPTPQKELKRGNETRNRQVKIRCRSKEKALLRKWFVDPERCQKRPSRMGIYHVV